MPIGGRGPDMRIYIREDARENVGCDGRLQTEPEAIQPVFHVDSPPGITLKRKRKMFAKVTNAVVEAYLAIPTDVVSVRREHQIASVGANGRQSDNQLGTPEEAALSKKA